MKSDSQESLKDRIQKILIIFFCLSLILLVLCFKNIFFQSTLLLKNFGKITMDPEIAFTNKKPTFLEYYAEWCEVCKEMAPEINQIRKEFSDDINFVFLNVDNPRWDKYIKKYNVNGIPQLNLFDSDSNLKSTFIGLQKESLINESLNNLLNNKVIAENNDILSFSSIQQRKNDQINPRSHG